MSDAPQGPGWWQASDGKWYPPQPAAAPPPTAPPPPQPGYYPVGPPPQQQGMNGCLKAFLIVFGIFVVLGVIATVLFVVFLDEVADNVGDLADDFERRQEEARREVSLVDCREEGGNMVAEIRIDNESGGRSNYTVTVSFDAPNGDQITTGTAFVSSLGDGQGTTEVVDSFADAVEGFDCEIGDVLRISAD